jgi:hypothetical protein
VVPGAATGVGAGRLQHRPDGAARVGQRRVGPSADQGDAGGGADQPQQHAQGGGLAGPVGAKEPGDLSRPDLDGQLLDRPDPAELLGQAVDRDRCWLDRSHHVLRQSFGTWP